MAQQITPLAPSLPATTAIQDPAARRFAQAVQDALGALRSEAGAVESLNKAAAALSGSAGGTPASIAQWLLTSELYQKLRSEIVAVDVQAKQDLLAEAIARQSAIDGIQATLASIEATPEYDPLVTYAVGDMVTYTGKLYRALLETTGNLPTDLTYWEMIGDYASLGEAVSAHAIKLDDLEYSMYNPAGEVQAEVAARQTLATQMRGTYAGTDITQVTQGLMYSERVARSSAYDAEVAARQSLATKVLGQADPTGLTLATLTSGLIFEEAQVRSDVDGSLAQTIDALEVTMGENIEAAMLAEQTVRATNDAALVSAINTAWAFTGATQAVSQSGQNLITNWTAAQANRWSQLEAEVFTAGGKTIRAALSEESDARATLEGQVSSSWMVKAEIDAGTGTPYVAGIALGAEGQGGAATSAFIIRADKFAVVMPGYDEHVPFAIGPSGAEFTGLTNWGNVQSRPGDEDILNTGSNLILNHDLRNSPQGDGTTAKGWSFNANSGAFYYRGVLQDSTNGPPFDLSAPMFYTNSTGADGQVSWITDEYIPVGADRNYTISAWLRRYSGNPSAYLGVICYDAAYASLGYLYPAGLTSLNSTTLSASWGHRYGVFGPGYTAFPVGTKFVRVVWWGTYLSIGATLATRFCFNEGVVPSRSIVPLDSSLINKINPITSSNVTTYIENAALGNAQIGGNLWSTNWNYAGGTGWLLDRSGNFYGNNIYARGDIEASSLQAGVAMVDSLNLKGSAVIIPLQVSYGAKSVNLPYSQGVWQIANAFQYTLSLSGGGLFKLSFTGTFYIYHWTGHANYGSGSLTKAVRIYINGSLVETVLTNQPLGASAELGPSTIPDRFYWLGAGNQTILITMEALMADGGARVACSAGTVAIQSFQTGGSSV